jgi:hypothetical protein
MATIKRTAVLVALVSALFAQPGRASPVFPFLLNDGTVNPATASANVMCGFKFTVGATDATVNALGLWDENEDGLSQSHEVGLWKWVSASSGVFVTSVTIPAGTGAELINEFRWVDLPANVVLDANTTYVVAALYLKSSPDRFRGLSNSTTTDADEDTTYAVPAGSASLASSVLAYPTLQSTNGVNMYVGPNVSFIPEPASMVLLLCGAALLAPARRRSVQ